MKDLRIVVPAYNEEEGIGATLDRVIASCPGAEIIVVDDASRDRTAQIARERGITVISNEVNRGYGGALKVGFNAHNEGQRQIKYIAFLDADGTYTPERIPDLYKLCSERGYDIVVGSRLTIRKNGMSLIRRAGNKIFACLASFYTGRKVTDTASGLRVFKIEHVPWVQKLPDGLNLTPAMTVNALFEGYTYGETSIEYKRRTGRSKLSSLRDGWRFLVVIMNAARKYRPLRFWCTLGVPFVLVKFFVRK